MDRPKIAPRVVERRSFGRSLEWDRLPTVGADRRARRRPRILVLGLALYAIGATALLVQLVS